jgi:hypothetical protein
MAPIVVGAALLAVEGACGLMRSGRISPKAAWGGAAALVAVFFACQWQDPQNVRAKTERWEWDGEVIGRLLKTAFGAARPLLAADAAGTLPYFSELPALDMLGLSDRYLARHPPPDLGEGWLGHELGDGRYVLEREPDLVVFTGPAGGPPRRFKSGLEMFREPRFAERYRLVGFEGHDPYVFRSAIFARAEGGRIGIVREPNRVRVPGYLLSANVMRGSFAKLDAEGRIGTHVLPGISAGIRRFPLAAGRWHLRVQHSGGPIRTQVRSAATGAVLAEGADVLELELPGSGPQTIDVELRSLSGEDAHLRALVFRRSE